MFRWKLVCLTLFLMIITTSLAKCEEISLAFVGDILLARHVGRNMADYGYDYPFSKVNSILRNTDLAFGNFECTLYGNTITGSNKFLVFRTPKRFSKAIAKSGIKIVSLANNHMLDAGRDGIVTTKDTLENEGILTIGAGQNADEAYQPVFIDKKGLRIGFLAFTDKYNMGLQYSKALANRPGVASASDPKVEETIKRVKKQCDLLVVSFHYGEEYQTKPNKRERYLVNQALGSGADIVIGHHPHVLQPIAQTNGKTVAYSLGNFIFDNSRPVCSKTEILIVKYDSVTKKQSVQIIPCYIKNTQPKPL